MLADIIAAVIYYIHFYAISTIYGQEGTPIMRTNCSVVYMYLTNTKA